MYNKIVYSAARVYVLSYSIKKTAVFKFLFLALCAGVVAMFVSYATIGVRASEENSNKIVELINKERSAMGVPALRISSTLETASAKHNSIMADCSKQYGKDDCFTHQVTQLNENPLMERINSLGYNAQSVAENIAWGYGTPEETVRGWMNSLRHKAVILNVDKLEIGCHYLDSQNGNYQGNYWTCNFGKSFTQTQSSTNPSTIPRVSPHSSIKPSPSTKTTQPLKVITPSGNVKTSPAVRQKHVPRSSAQPIPSRSTPVKNSIPRFCIQIPEHPLCSTIGMS